MLFKQKAEVMVDHISKHLREAGQEEISDEERKVEVERLALQFQQKSHRKDIWLGCVFCRRTVDDIYMDEGNVYGDMRKRLEAIKKRMEG
jgi:hypothetical protein